MENAASSVVKESGKEAAKQLESYLIDCGKDAVESFITGAGGELGKQVVGFGVKLGTEWVKHACMIMLTRGVVNVANGMKGKRGNIRLIESYKPGGNLAQFALVCAAVKAVVKHSLPPLVKPKAALKAKGEAQVSQTDKDARVLKNLFLAYMVYLVFLIAVSMMLKRS